jgi:hypothetical protein
LGKALGFGAPKARRRLAARQTFSFAFAAFAAVACLVILGILSHRTAFASLLVHTHLTLTDKLGRLQQGSCDRNSHPHFSNITRRPRPRSSSMLRNIERA